MPDDLHPKWAASRVPILRSKSQGVVVACVPFDWWQSRMLGDNSQPSAHVVALGCDVPLARLTRAGGEPRPNMFKGLVRVEG